ncbi:hypothetical protein O7632_11605 [Solwaraspora sp. WMMD406]|nr:hypothetical protein [Solwaraspora sp. WMMD406]MDG4764744.1 hypothetical protein [Solwaraspora sp. WMMD406]
MPITDGPNGEKYLLDVLIGAADAVRECEGELLEHNDSRLV